TPASGTNSQSLWLEGVLFDFDEALDPASVSPGVVQTSSSAGVVAPGSVTLVNNNQRLVLSLTAPLAPGVTYTNTLLSTLTDTSGNLWRSLGGGGVPAAGVAFTFTTARIFPSNPVNGTRVVAGQNVSVTARYDPGLGAVAFRFQVNGQQPVQVAAGS